MKMLIVGAGSIGGYFGARLMQVGRDVSFLVRPGRAAALRDKGLQVVSPHGDATLQPQLLTAPELAQPFDVVLLAVKAFALDAALRDMAPAVGPETMIVPLLNGMKHVDDLQTRFGTKPVVGGVCRIATQLDEQGRVVQLSPGQELLVGELVGQRSDRLDRLGEFFAGAGFEARTSDDITQDLWNKWVMLASLGAIGTLARATVGEIEATEGGQAFVRALLMETVAVATASGHPPAERVVEGTFAMLTTKGAPLTSSMYRDLLAGAAVEVDQVLGDLVARGQRLGVATPLINAACVQLSIYQRQRAH